MAAVGTTSLKDLLLRAKELSDDEIATLRASLEGRTVKDLRLLAKTLSVKLTGSSRKADIADRLIVMGKIGAIRGEASEEYDYGYNTELSYITDEVKAALTNLPTFERVTDWKKDLKGVLKEFHFMNLLVYLVYSRDKSFDMQSLKAFKSLKAYKYFYDGFVRNVWVNEPVAGVLSQQPRIIYFRAYVHHSLTCNEPLTVFVAMNGDSGDVYAAKCNCVSG